MGVCLSSPGNMFQILIVFGLVSSALTVSDPDSEYEYGVFGVPNTPRIASPRLVQEQCSVESVSITWTNCKIEFTESCTMEEKVVGDRITYKEECEEKEVEVCKPVHYIPRSNLGGIVSAPRKVDTDCKTVMKKVFKEVEICVQTPNEKCTEGTQLAPKTTCEKVQH